MWVVRTLGVWGFPKGNLAGSSGCTGEGDGDALLCKGPLQMVDVGDMTYTVVKHIWCATHCRSSQTTSTGWLTL